ncbi:MAG: hypothetical protein N2C14_03305, partial [Planctomycetales bacterium]
AFLQSGDDASLKPENKLALAVSGWLMGSNSAITNFATATSLWDVRNLVRDYLQEPVKLNRDRILDKIRRTEGGNAEQIAKLLANMKPIAQTPPQQIPGFYELTVTTSEGVPCTYFVQLPREYDPRAHYPAILTLHGSGSVAAHSLFKPNKKHVGRPSQTNWWAGPVGPRGTRETGQAVRQGYIVIAPAWSEPNQAEYRYSATTHAKVLAALRDASRRFSVDADRVFLSGHGIGGDAAWDIGLAHPDLWAGVIPIVGVADKYTAFYWKNAETVPFYCVGGEFDQQKLVRNSREWDRMMIKRHDLTVVEYLGRGHEHFGDEILEIFKWMELRRRDFHPHEFLTHSMRPSDGFFWWVEVAGFPQNSIVHPSDFPIKRQRPITIEARVNQNNGVWIKTGAKRVTLWLSPDVVDFNQRTIISVNGKRINADPFLKPDVAVMLEDVRTRGDRRQPFWMKISNGR